MFGLPEATRERSRKLPAAEVRLVLAAVRDEPLLEVSIAVRQRS